MKNRVKTIVMSELVNPPVFAIATTTVRRHQAVTSSTAAQAMAVVPRWVLVSPRSSMMRTSTGKAVILIATPMNSAKALKDTSGEATEGYMNSDRVMPSKIGTMMLA